MVTFTFILSFISILTSFIPIAGIIVGTIVLILSLICLKAYAKITYKKRTIITCIVLSVVTIINSFIFTFYVNVFDNFLLSNTTEIVDNAKYTRLLQDYSSLQTAINYSKGTSNSIKKLITSENKQIIKNTLDLAGYPVNLRNMIAINDNNIKYYNINYNSIKLNLMLSKTDCWVIDRNGRLYINIENLKNY